MFDFGLKYPLPPPRCVQIMLFQQKENKMLNNYNFTFKMNMFIYLANMHRIEFYLVSWINVDLIFLSFSDVTTISHFFS